MASFDPTCSPRFNAQAALIAVSGTGQASDQLKRAVKVGQPPTLVLLRMGPLQLVFSALAGLSQR